MKPAAHAIIDTAAGALLCGGYYCAWDRVKKNNDVDYKPLYSYQIEDYLKEIGKPLAGVFMRDEIPHDQFGGY